MSTFDLHSCCAQPQLRSYDATKLEDAYPFHKQRIYFELKSVMSTDKYKLTHGLTMELAISYQYFLNPFFLFGRVCNNFLIIAEQVSLFPKNNK